MLSKHSESFYKMSDGASICVHIFSNSLSAESGRACLLTHGQGEHGRAYKDIVELLDPSIEYWCWDLRGHGSSDGTRGYIKDFSTYVSDWKDLFDQLSNKKDQISLFGHSMGGLISTLGLLELNSTQIKKIEGLVLSSPLFGLSLDVPEFKKQAAGLLQKLNLEFTLGNEIALSQLKRNPIYLKEHSRDVFRHQKISAAAYLGLLQGCETIQTESFKFNFPTLLSLGLKDSIINLKAAEDSAKAHFNSLEVLKFAEALHEPLNDFERSDACEKIKVFLQKLPKQT